MRSDAVSSIRGVYLRVAARIAELVQDCDIHAGKDVIQAFERGEPDFRVKLVAKSIKEEISGHERKLVNRDSRILLESKLIGKHVAWILCLIASELPDWLMEDSLIQLLSRFPNLRSTVSEIAVGEFAWAERILVSSIKSQKEPWISQREKDLVNTITEKSAFWNSDFIRREKVRNLDFRGLQKLFDCDLKQCILGWDRILQGLVVKLSRDSSEERAKIYFSELDDLLKSHILGVLNAKYTDAAQISISSEKALSREDIALMVASIRVFLCLKIQVPTCTINQSCIEYIVLLLSICSNSFSKTDLRSNELSMLFGVSVLFILLFSKSFTSRLNSQACIYMDRLSKSPAFKSSAVANWIICVYLIYKYGSLKITGSLLQITIKDLFFPGSHCTALRNFNVLVPEKQSITSFLEVLTQSGIDRFSVAEGELYSCLNNLVELNSAYLYDIFSALLTNGISPFSTLNCTKDFKNWVRKAIICVSCKNSFFRLSSIIESLVCAFPCLLSENETVELLNDVLHPYSENPVFFSDKIAAFRSVLSLQIIFGSTKVYSDSILSLPLSKVIRKIQAALFCDEFNSLTEQLFQNICELRPDALIDYSSICPLVLKQSAYRELPTKLKKKISSLIDQIENPDQLNSLLNQLLTKSITLDLELAIALTEKVLVVEVSTSTLELQTCRKLFISIWYETFARLEISFLLNTLNLIILLSNRFLNEFLREKSTEMKTRTLRQKKRIVHSTLSSTSLSCQMILLYPSILVNSVIDESDLLLIFAKCPTLFILYIEILNFILPTSRCALASISSKESLDSDFPAVWLLELCVIVQFLLKAWNKFPESADVHPRIVNFLNKAFLQNDGLLEMIHRQGYEISLLEKFVSSIPSVIKCTELFPETRWLYDIQLTELSPEIANLMSFQFNLTVQLALKFPGHSLSVKNLSDLLLSILTQSSDDLRFCALYSSLIGDSISTLISVANRLRSLMPTVASLVAKLGQKFPEKRQECAEALCRLRPL